MSTSRKRSISGPAVLAVLATPSPKRKKYDCVYQNSWEKEFRWVQTSDKGKHDAFCRFCKVNIGINHGAKNDLIKHSKTSNHEKCEKSATGCNVQQFLNSSKIRHSEKVIKAETAYSLFVAEHNLPFAISDHFTKLTKTMFPDSAIATDFACAKTKTTQIVKRAIAAELCSTVVKQCISQNFSIMCDESNDKGGQKSFVILVRLFDQELERPVTRFLDMPIVNVGTGNNLFNALDQVMVKNGIPWGNVFGFVSDNCSVMKGKKNSVLSRIREKQPNIMDIGCICHLANLCCGAAVKQLPLPVEDLLVDVFFHFHHSAKRLEEYKEFLEFCDIEPLKILKHCSTRWLSLQKCVERTLHHWPSLRSYFLSHKDGDREGRVKRTGENLANPEMMLYYLFLDFILVPMNEFNTAFQADISRIGVLHDHITKLLRKFLGKFVKVNSILAADDITEVKYTEKECQLPNEILAVGPKARAYILDNMDEIGVETESKFFKYVRKFYCAAVEKMIKKFPFHDQTFKSLQLVNPDRKPDLDASMIYQLLSRFPDIIPKELEVKLVDEFMDYRLTPAAELGWDPAGDRDFGKFWGQMKNINDPFSDSPRFGTLARLVQALLVLPNSNADSERAFSIVRKIQTDYRTELGNDTMCALLSCKFNEDSACYSYCPSGSTLKAAKAASMEYNKEHQ